MVICDVKYQTMVVKLLLIHIWVLLDGRECGLVYLPTQLFSFEKNLQYKPIDENNIPNYYYWKFKCFLMTRN